MRLFIPILFFILILSCSDRSRQHIIIEEQVVSTELSSLLKKYYLNFENPYLVYEEGNFSIAYIHEDSLCWGKVTDSTHSSLRIGSMIQKDELRSLTYTKNYIYITTKKYLIQVDVNNHIIKYITPISFKTNEVSRYIQYHPNLQISNDYFYLQYADLFGFNQLGDKVFFVFNKDSSFYLGDYPKEFGDHYVQESTSKYLIKDNFIYYIFSIHPTFYKISLDGEKVQSMKLPYDDYLRFDENKKTDLTYLMNYYQSTRMNKKLIELDSFFLLQQNYTNIKSSDLIHTNFVLINNDLELLEEKRISEQLISVNTDGLNREKLFFNLNFDKLYTLQIKNNL